MKKISKKTPPNPYARNTRVIARVNNEEMHVFLKKALLYFGNQKGAMSELIREAVLNYKGKKS